MAVMTRPRAPGIEELRRAMACVAYADDGERVPRLRHPPAPVSPEVLETTLAETDASARAFLVRGQVPVPKYLWCKG